MIRNIEVKIPVMSDLYSKGEQPDYLLWIGCAGAFDERYKKVIKSLVIILNMAKINFAVLGPEEACTGDPAKRAGNEFLFQMQALANIQVLNNYNINKIITACPHCYNTIKNEYKELGGNYETFHHSEFLESLLTENEIVKSWKIDNTQTKITYHDSCYLGRSNGIYESPRKVLQFLNADIVEMERNKASGLCCGAGGSQMFKEAEKGEKEINMVRTEEVLNTKADVLATACPFCLTMMTDGLKNVDKEDQVKVLDIVELFERGVQD